MSRDRKRHRDDTMSQELDVLSSAKRVKDQSRDKLDSAISLKRTLSTIREDDRDDDDDDSSDMGHDLLAAWFNTSKESDKFLLSFKNQIERDKNTIRALLEKRVKEANGKTTFNKELRQTAFLVVLELDPSIKAVERYIAANGAYKLSAAQKQMIHALEIKPNFNSLSETANSILEQSYDLIKTYETLAVGINQVDENRVAEAGRMWQKDKEEVIKLLAKGREVSLMRIKHILPTATNNVALAVDDTSDISYNEVSRFFPRREADDREIQETFRQAAKGVRRLVKNLPRDDE